MLHQFDNEASAFEHALATRQLFNVPDVEPFVLALTNHARLAVVVELPLHHPLAGWSAAWKHFWGIDRPTGPTSDDLVAVLRALGVEPEMWQSPRSSLSRSASDPARLVESSRRRLCLPASRDEELAAYLAEHPPTWEDTVVTIRWPGSADQRRRESTVSRSRWSR